MTAREKGPFSYKFSGPVTTSPAVAGWHFVLMPGSKEFFGSGKAIRVRATIDGEEVTTSFMPTGDGGHMLPLKGPLLKKLGMGVGDEVTVHLHERLN